MLLELADDFLPGVALIDGVLDSLVEDSEDGNLSCVVLRYHLRNFGVSNSYINGVGQLHEVSLRVVGLDQGDHLQHVLIQHQGDE